LDALAREHHVRENPNMITILLRYTVILNRNIHIMFYHGELDIKYNNESKYFEFCQLSTKTTSTIIQKQLNLMVWGQEGEITKC